MRFTGVKVSFSGRISAENQAVSHAPGGNHVHAGAAHIGDHHVVLVHGGGQLHLGQGGHTVADARLRDGRA